MSSELRHPSSANLLSATLGKKWRRGWFMAWPSVEDGKSFLFAVFHVHPDDADDLERNLQAAIGNYDGETQWNLSRRNGYRFLLCPKMLADKAADVGNLGRAAEEVSLGTPHVERETAADLLKLIECIEKF